MFISIDAFNTSDSSHFWKHRLLYLHFTLGHTVAAVSKWRLWMWKQNVDHFSKQTKLWTLRSLSCWKKWLLSQSPNCPWHCKWHLQVRVAGSSPRKFFSPRKSKGTLALMHCGISCLPKTIFPLPMTEAVLPSFCTSSGYRPGWDQWARLYSRGAVQKGNTLRFAKTRWWNLSYQSFLNSLAKDWRAKTKPITQKEFCSPKEATSSEGTPRLEMTNRSAFRSLH